MEASTEQVTQWWHDLSVEERAELIFKHEKAIFIAAIDLAEKYTEDNVDPAVALSVVGFIGHLPTVLYNAEANEK